MFEILAIITNSPSRRRCQFVRNLVYHHTKIHFWPYDVSTSVAISTLKFTTKNHIFSTKCPICYVDNRDVIARMSSPKDSRKVWVQFDTCFMTAYSFPKMFFIGKNLKHVPVLYFFLELLTFFWLTLLSPLLKLLKSKKNSFWQNY